MKPPELNQAGKRVQSTFERLAAKPEARQSPDSQRQPSYYEGGSSTRFIEALGRASTALQELKLRFAGVESKQMEATTLAELIRHADFTSTSRDPKKLIKEAETVSALSATTELAVSYGSDRLQLIKTELQQAAKLIDGIIAGTDEQILAKEFFLAGGDVDCSETDYMVAAEALYGALPADPTYRSLLESSLGSRWRAEQDLAQSYTPGAGSDMDDARAETERKAQIENVMIMFKSNTTLVEAIRTLITDDTSLMSLEAAQKVIQDEKDITDFVDPAERAEDNWEN